MNRFDREQLVVVVEVVLDAALEHAADNHGDHGAINGSIATAGLMLSTMHHRLTGDGTGALEATGFDHLVWNYMRAPGDNVPLPSCRPVAERFVDAAFANYLKGTE